MAHGARILVVDDEASVRTLIDRSLTQAGYQITVAEDGSAALSALERNVYDLLISDIVMPGLDGLALALAAQGRQPGLKIMLISGYPAERQRAVNLDILAKGVLAKPFSLAELKEMVAKCLAG